MSMKSSPSSYYGGDSFAHTPVIPPITIEFTTLLEQDGDASEIDSSESRIKDFERHSYLVANVDCNHDSGVEEDDLDILDLADSDIDQPRFRSPMDKEQSAYPTHLAYEPIDMNLGAALKKPAGQFSIDSAAATATTTSFTSASEGTDKISREGSEGVEVDPYYHPGRTASTGSDLVQVTVEDLMISKEQQKVVLQDKATIRSRPTSTMVPQRSGSSTTIITATIRRSNEPNKARATMYFEEEEGGINETQPPPVHGREERRGQGEQKDSKEKEVDAKTRKLVSAPIILPSSTSTSRSTVPTKPKQEQQQQQQPPKILTPAQQLEAEVDANIQKAIELHENNQLEEATRYFYLAAQSENPLGQLMYGLSLRHGWGCKANPNESIVYLQRAAEFAMGELKELHPIPGSQRHQHQHQHQHQQGSSPSVPQSPVSALPSSPTSPSSLGFLPGQKSESRLGSGSKVAPSTHQPMQQSALKRMGSLDRKAATVMARKELVMALYELGMSFLKGWGVQKDKSVAFTYFKIAADLGDPDSQNETGLCYYEGIGIEKDMYQSAKYYRMAAAQGSSQLGNSWIWKPKYDQYCAAEISAAEAAEANAARFATLNKINHPPVTSGQGQKRFSLLKLSSPPSSKKMTSPPSSSGSSGGDNRSSLISPPSSSPSNNNPSVAVSPSIPSPQYTVAGIAAGLASVTAATAIAVASASPSGDRGRGRSNSHSPSTTAGTLFPIPVSLSHSSSPSSSKNSPLSSPPMSPVSSLPPSLPLSPTTSERKRRWSLWGSSKSNSLSSSPATTGVPQSQLPLENSIY